MDIIKDFEHGTDKIQFNWGFNNATSDDVDTTLTSQLADGDSISKQISVFNDTDNNESYVYYDVNGDDTYKEADDIVIKLEGVSNIDEGDFLI